jgi:hypothetical protein
MEDFLRLKYGEEMPIDRIIEDKIAARLNQDALPVFHLENSHGSLHFPEWGFVSVPVQAPNILAGIKNYQKSSVSNARFTIKQSELKNRIFWLNTKNGIPLYSYSPLSKYEESYEKTILEREGIGRHLVQTEKENWAYLPSPIPEQSWGDTYRNERLHDYNASIRTMFDQAMDYKVITEKHSDLTSSARYECHFTKEISIPDLFAQYEIDPKQLNKATLGSLKQVLRPLKDMFNGGMESDGKSDIFDSTTLPLAKENFVRSPKLIEKVKFEIRKYSLIKEKITEIEQYIASQEENEATLKSFIQAIYTKTIRKKGALYVYDKEIEEDAWEPFVNLLKTTKFVEYEIYQTFKALGPKQMDQLQKKMDRRFNDLTSQENTNELVAALEEMAATYSKEKEALDYDYKYLANGEELYSFYKEMMLKVNEMLGQLKS